MTNPAPSSHLAKCVKSVPALALRLSPSPDL